MSNDESSAADRGSGLSDQLGPCNRSEKMDDKTLLLKAGLDPACGSGNFLYLALKALKDLEHKINLEAEALGLQRQHDVTGPHNVLGIEINEYASELARITIWIGELQWRAQHGYSFKTNPVLEPLDCIETRDAIVNADGTEASWPPASVVVGNPPFLGTKKMRREVGNEYPSPTRCTAAHWWAWLLPTPQAWSSAPTRRISHCIQAPWQPIPTVKRLKRTTTGWLLQAANPDFADIPVGDNSELNIWGVVTRVIHAV